MVPGPSSLGFSHNFALENVLLKINIKGDAGVKCFSLGGCSNTLPRPVNLRPCKVMYIFQRKNCKNYQICKKGRIDNGNNFLSSRHRYAELGVLDKKENATN